MAITVGEPCTFHALSPSYVYGCEEQDDHNQSWDKQQVKQAHIREDTRKNNIQYIVVVAP